MRALHFDDDIGVVSLLVEIPAGGMLAERKLAATSETLILDGGALHPVLGPLTATDYLREEAPVSTSTTGNPGERSYSTSSRNSTTP